MRRLGGSQPFKDCCSALRFWGPGEGQPGGPCSVKHVINNYAVPSRLTERDPSAGSASRGTGLIYENSKCGPGPTAQQQTPQEPSWGSSGWWVFSFVSQAGAFEPVPNSPAGIWATLCGLTAQKQLLPLTGGNPR